MTRLLLALGLIASLPSAAFAQFPSQNITLPAFVIPASAVDGGGAVVASLIPTADNTYDLGSSSFQWRSLYLGTSLNFGADVSLSRPAANVLTLASGDMLSFGGVTSSVPLLKNNGVELQVRLGDDTNYSSFVASNLRSNSAAVTVGSGTGISVNQAAAITEQVYKVTVASTAFTCAAATCDVTVATLPAKTQITAVIADLTTAFACTATCTSSTLSMVFGRGSGGAQWLASFDADAAAAQFGDADAELGTTMTRAAAIQAGSFESWSSTQAAVLRLTSGTGNIGNGSATNLSQGSVTIYLVTRVMP